jgi:DNA-binding SARP family transcriptional activator
MATTDPEQVRLAEAVVRETRRLQAVERALAEGRVPLHVTPDAPSWLEAQRERLDDLYAELMQAWEREQQAFGGEGLPYDL